jgi:hypothetical protein
MSKYAPLGDFLQSQPATEVPLSFAEIERIIGVPLPPKAKDLRAWWSNNPANNVMTKVWLGAGFQTERVDISGRRLVFRRVKSGPPAVEEPPGRALRHPAFGAMKGTITVMPGVDLTEPLWESEGGEA